MLDALRAFDPRSERLTSLDASFLYLEGREQLMHVGCVAILEGRVPFDAFAETEGRRLGQLTRYRQRPIRAPFDLTSPTWEDDPTFDPANHIRHVTLPSPGGAAELHRIVDDLFATPFDPRYPLWETYLIDGLASGGSALLSKMHHCMIDGVSGVQILEVMTDAAPDVHEVPPPVPSNGGPARDRQDRTPLAQLGAALSRTSAAIANAPGNALQAGRGAVEALNVLGGFARAPAPTLPINGALSTGRRIAWTTFPLDDFLAMRGAAGCKVNDVVLAVIAGGLRRYLLEHDTAVDGVGVRAMVPVSIRGAGEHLTLGNRVSAMFATLPLDIVDPLERLHAIARDTRALKDRGQREAMDLVLGATSALPSPLGAAVTRLAGRWPVVNTVCTNVPGSPHVRYVLGTPVREIHPLVPLAVQIGLGFAILSYGGTLSITATADANLVPDVHAVARALEASAHELRARLGVGPHEPTIAPAATAPSVESIMSRKVETIRIDDPLSWAWEMMQRHRIRHLPVLDAEHRLVGVLTHRDLLAASESMVAGHTRQRRPLLRPSARTEDVMEAHVSTAAPDEPAAEAGRRMVRHKIGCLPVVAPRGALVGIVTEQDFMRWATEHMLTSDATSMA